MQAVGSLFSTLKPQPKEKSDQLYTFSSHIQSVCFFSLDSTMMCYIETTACTGVINHKLSRGIFKGVYFSIFHNHMLPFTGIIIADKKLGIYLC